MLYNASHNQFCALCTECNHIVHAKVLGLNAYCSNNSDPNIDFGGFIKEHQH